jgi:hypothetical protein
MPDDLMAAAQMYSRWGWFKAHHPGNQDRLAKSMITAANHRHCGSFMWLIDLSSDSAVQGIGLFAVHYLVP